jgi:Na+/phosphate symporter
MTSEVTQIINKAIDMPYFAVWIITLIGFGSLFSYILADRKNQDKKFEIVVRGQNSLDDVNSDSINQTVVIAHSYNKVSDIRDKIIDNLESWKRKRNKVNENTLAELKKVTDARIPTITGLFNILRRK